MAGAGWKRALGWLNNYRGLVALFLVFVIGCIFSPKSRTGGSIFLSSQTQLGVLFDYCEYGMLATGMTLVILSGGIDLSVGSVVGLCATLFALLTVGYGWAVPAAVAVVMLVGIVLGGINGTLISRFRLQPFVVTLAMMTAARGMAKLISGGIKVQPAAKPWYALQHDTPGFFRWMDKALPGIGVQPATLLFLGCILLMALIVRNSGYGRKLYAIGGNEEAARLSGIPVGWTKIATYSLCAMFAAVAGIMATCYQDIGDPEAGVGYELDAIAAVVIGGTSLMGGRGGMMFTLIGVLTMAYINKILSLNAVDIAPRMIIQAGIIIAAVLIQRQKRGTA